MLDNNVKQFKEKGYTLVKNAVSEDVVNLITQYALFDEARDFNPDPMQVPGAHAKYGDPVMESLLSQLQGVIEKNTGLKVEPTYSFYRVYRPGDELKPHKDRPSCEISITVSLGYDYQNSDYVWPIFVDGTPCVLEPGDLVCYRGVDLEHWREKFDASENSWHVQAFLHYVDVNGPFVEYQKDGRPSIGLPDSTRDLEKIKSLNEKLLPKNKENSTENQKNTSTQKSYIEYTN
jgi:hypothetical protein